MQRLVGVLYAVSSLGSAAAWNLSAFVACRFLAGIAIGASLVLAPVYLAEIAPANRRGTLVGLFQLNIVIGILLAYGSNCFLVAQSIAGPDDRRCKLGVSTIPAVICFRSAILDSAQPALARCEGMARRSPKEFAPSRLCRSACRVGRTLELAGVAACVAPVLLGAASASDRARHRTRVLQSIVGNYCCFMLLW
jgi:MFS family permease